MRFASFVRTAAFLAVCALTLSLTACDTAAPVSDAVTANAAQKTAVCHATGSEDNPYVLIDVADAALPAHVAHGDASPGEAVPTMPGFTFDEACVPQEVNLCPCFTSDDLLAITAENNLTRTSCSTASALPFIALIQNDSSTPDVNGGFAAGQGGSTYPSPGPFCATRDPLELTTVSTAEAAACAQLIVDRCATIGDAITASVGGTTSSSARASGGSPFGF